jgi:hypothetical protein
MQKLKNRANRANPRAPHRDFAERRSRFFIFRAQKRKRNSSRAQRRHFHRDREPVAKRNDVRTDDHDEGELANVEDEIDDGCGDAELRANTRSSNANSANERRRRDVEEEPPRVVARELGRRVFANDVGFAFRSPKEVYTAEAPPFPGPRAPPALPGAGQPSDVTIPLSSRMCSIICGPMNFSYKTP